MENAELYSSANGMQKKDAKEILGEFSGRIKWPKAAKILDVGCGSGDVTTEIILPRVPKDFKELIGMDISLEMIQHARNLHSHPKVSFIQFNLAQASENLLGLINNIVPSSKTNELSQKKNRCSSSNAIKSPNILEAEENKCENSRLYGYDILFSFYCLHWITDQRLAVRNIYRLLKPGGEGLIVFLIKSPIFTLYRKLSTMDVWKKYMQDVDNFIPFYQDSNNPVEDFSEILNSTGFQIMTIDGREKSYKFNNFLSLRDAIVAVNPFLSRMTNDIQEEFINECLRLTEFLKLTEFKNNCYRVRYKLLIAHIRKPV